MGFSNCGGCYSMPDYESADKHFKRTPWPKAKSCGRPIWGDNERPLDGDRAHHYRLEKHDSRADGEQVPGYNYHARETYDFYDVCLYSTTMARYHKPLEDGSRCIEYTNHGSNLSGQFKWRVTRMSDVLSFGDIRVPVAYRELGTTIWLNAAGQLIKEKSSHQPVYKYVTSDAQKQWRAKLKESTKNLAMLLEIGMEKRSGITNTGRYRHPGKPFQGNDEGRLLVNGYPAPLRGWDGELTPDTEVSVVEALQQLWTTCHQHILDKRDYADNTTPVKPVEVTRSWYTMLDRLNPHQKTSVPIPDFPTADQLPQKFHF